MDQFGVGQVRRARHQGLDQFGGWAQPVPMNTRLPGDKSARPPAGVMIMSAYFSFH